MQQNTQRPVSSIAYPILIALSISHCLNDLLQSVITATYPLFKEDLTLSFAQIGLITLVYQMSASVFQPVFGLFFDKRPFAWTLPMGMLFTMTGLLNLAFSTNLYWVLFSVFIIGIGSSVLHRKHRASLRSPPEAEEAWHNPCFRWVATWEDHWVRYW